MLLIILFRVHTEFWTQNSRLFPGLGNQDFFTNSWLGMNPILFTVHVCTISVIFKWFKAEWPLNKYCTVLKGVDWIKAAWCFDHLLTFKTLAMFWEHLNRHSLTIFPNIGKDQSHLKSVQKKVDELTDAALLCTSTLTAQVVVVLY